MEAVRERTIHRPKQRCGRKAVVLVVFVVLVVVIPLGGRWFWRRLQFSQLRVPLIEAVKTGNTVRVGDLLDQGADPDVRLDYQPEPMTWTHVLRLLQGKRQTAPSEENTVLMAAAEEGRADIVQQLLEHGAEVGATDILQFTALDQAALVGAMDCVKLLIAHGANVNGRSTHGYTSLFHAIEGDSEGEFRANSPKPESCVELLLQHGAEVDARDDSGQTPLIYSMFVFRLADASPTVRRLLNQGAHIEAADMEGKTALIQAASYGEYEAIQTLLQCGAEADRADGYGKTALMYAIECANPTLRGPYLGTIQSLLKKGADATRKDKFGRSALKIAQNLRDKEVLALLRKAIARKPAGH